MDEYIKRQAARRTLGDFIVEGVTAQDLVMNFREIVLNRIDALPSVDAPQWIPCSKRMPETTDEVLTTYIVNGNTKKRYVEPATWWPDEEGGGSWSSPYDECRVLGTKITVIAWMPLPEPWRGKQDG